jgi:aromatic ring-opening dioxygenase catalytic subunit (LigB family)
VGFVGHGNPLNVLDPVRSAPWNAWGRSLPRPKAILTVSAHWEDVPVAIGRMGATAWDDHPAPPDYVAKFDAWVTRALEQNDHAALQDWMNSAPSPLRSHPSAEHYRPIVFAAGAARGATARFPITGFEHGTISRRSVQLD